jgi:hypothetical protein
MVRIRGFKRMETIEDKTLMNHSERWPAWPILPVLRFHTLSGIISNGILVDIQGVRNTVFEVDSFITIDVKSLLTDPTISKHIYKNTREVLANGWVPSSK